MFKASDLQNELAHETRTQHVQSNAFGMRQFWPTCFVPGTSQEGQDALARRHACSDAERHLQCAASARIKESAVVAIVVICKVMHGLDSCKAGVPAGRWPPGRLTHSKTSQRRTVQVTDTPVCTRAPPYCDGAELEISAGTRLHLCCLTTTKFNGVLLRPSSSLRARYAVCSCRSPRRRRGR